MILLQHGAVLDGKVELSARLSLQLAATELKFGPHSLCALQLPLWDPGSSPCTADTGCLPACLISPSCSRITAGSEHRQHSPDAARPPASRQQRDTQVCCGRASRSLVGREEQSWQSLSGSMNSEVQRDLLMQLSIADPKAAEGLPGLNQRLHPEVQRWGNTRMVPCTIPRCGRLHNPKQRCQDPQILRYLHTQPGYTQTPAQVCQEPRVLSNTMGSFKGSFQRKSLSQWLGWQKLICSPALLRIQQWGLCSREQK